MAARGSMLLRSSAWQRCRRWFAHTWELWVLALGHAFAGQFLANLATGLRQIDDPSVLQVTAVAAQVYTVVIAGPVPIRALGTGLFLLMLVLALRRQRLRRGCDLLGALLTARCGLQFVLLNLLLLAPLESGSMLLMQLLLFLPLVTLNFGWLYWRLDSGSRPQGCSQIRFDEEPPRAFDDFHVAANALLQFEPSGAKPLSRRMKTLFVIHGVVMMDLVALTLSRAIGLASAGA